MFIPLVLMGAVEGAPPADFNAASGHWLGRFGVSLFTRRGGAAP